MKTEIVHLSQYMLDRYIEKDPHTRYAVEVQIKDYQVTLGHLSGNRKNKAK
ncbi:MAG: hypothetical protein PHF76_11390 [Bacteroidales bacterium]|nr:hypothetical protein [Bacteroidales bacterium]MDD3915233.1 hypothetical protein [Bacteroidales bacterium]